MPMNPHTQHHIATGNDVLSDPEAHNVRNKLSDAETDLINLNERIAATRADLADPVHQRNELITETGPSSLAPHKRLPPEILSRIFIHCVPNPIHLPPTLYEGPLRLGQVCSDWRRVAQETPNLWNWISIILDCDTQLDHLDILDMAKMCIARTGAFTPLAIGLSMNPSVRGGVDWIQALIEPHISRCYELMLRLTPGPCRQFLRLPSGSAKILEEMHLDVVCDHDHSSREHSAVVVTLFDSADRLRSVSLNCAVNMFNGSQRLQLPSTQITDLDLRDTYLSPDTCLAILRQCPNLVDCIMEVDGCDGFEPLLTGLDPVVVPNLRLLELQPLVEASLAPFFRPLVLPALKTLKLTCFPNWSIDGLESLLSRSTCNLETFGLIGIDVDPSELESLLQHMPFVVNLDIPYQRTFNRPTLDMLFKGDVLPKLEVINLASFPPNVALDVIQSRWHLCADFRVRGNSNGVPVSRLREAMVSSRCRARVNGIILSRLRQFMREGLRLHFS